MRKQFFIFCLLTFLPLSFCANTERVKMTPAQYIENYKDEAIEEMLAHGIPASITLAQGMFESGNGNSDLAIYANNHFGIKCHKGWNGPTFTKDDDKKNECFRKYPTVLDSYNDHSNFLKTRSRYAGLFELKRTDYKGWAKGLKEAGYATNPRYTEQLLELIEKYSLHKYDYVKELHKNEVKETQKHKTTIHTKSTIPSNKELHKDMGPRIILRDRFVKYIIIREGDNLKKIAADTDKDLWQLYKFNDLEPNSELVVGQKLYLQPKRNRAKEPYHYVKTGETMKSISQLCGIKLKKLYKKNNMKFGDEPKVGDQLYMRVKKPFPDQSK